ncbi:unnamed protein product [Sphagnum tenellum]
MDRTSSRVPPNCSAKVAPHEKCACGTKQRRQNIGWDSTQSSIHPSALEAHFWHEATSAEHWVGLDSILSPPFCPRSVLLAPSNFGSTLGGT